MGVSLSFLYHKFTTASHTASLLRNPAPLCVCVCVCACVRERERESMCTVWNETNVNFNILLKQLYCASVGK